MEVIKWWKNKNFCILLAILLTAVVVSALLGQFVPFPYNLISILVVCGVSGFFARKKLIEVLKEICSK